MTALTLNELAIALENSAAFRGPTGITIVGEIERSIYSNMLNMAVAADEDEIWFFTLELRGPVSSGFATVILHFYDGKRVEIPCYHNDQVEPFQQAVQVIAFEIDRYISRRR